MLGSILSLQATPSSISPRSTPRDSRFKKAVKFHSFDADLPVTEKFRLLKEIGYDGTETRTPDREQLDRLRQAQETTGLPVHGLIHPDPELTHADTHMRNQAIDRLNEALVKARELEATTVLVVPTEVDEDTSYVDAYHRSQASLRETLPVARENGVKIALENVTNQFLLSPMEFARYIDEFESPWIGAYFDTGNVIGFGYPEQWIRTLGDRIIKLDIKDRYWGDAGRRLKLGEGDVNWPAVGEALSDIGFQGWATAEVWGGDRQRVREIYELMNTVLQG